MLDLVLPFLCLVVSLEFFFIALGESLNTCISFKPKLDAKSWNLPANFALFKDLKRSVSKKENEKSINITCSGINHSLKELYIRYNGIKWSTLI